MSTEIALLTVSPSRLTLFQSGEGSHQRGASFSLGHAHEPQMGGRQALIHGVSARRLQARYGY